MEYLKINLFGKGFYLGARSNVLVWAEWEKPEGKLNRENPFLLKVEKQLQEYLEGKRKVFSFKTEPAGTPFQKRVWDELLHIPWGKTISYFEMAQALGNPLSVRAVASAIGKNPIAIFIPCHRVISKSGGLGGYSGGLPTKVSLLKVEGHERRNWP